MALGVTKLFHYFSLFLYFATFTFAVDPYFQAKCVNTAGNYIANSSYESNLNTIFSLLISQTQFNYGFYNLTAGQDPDRVNAIALCRGDRNQDDCITCLNETVSELRKRCPSYKEVVGWSEFCMLRYANRNIYGEMETSPYACLLNVHDVQNYNEFNQVLEGLLEDVSSRASAGGSLRKYSADNSSVAAFQKVYALVQCTPDLSEEECGDCLSVATNRIGICCLRTIGCRVYTPSCSLRFESTFTQPSGKDNNTRRAVIIVVASMVGVLILIIIFVRVRNHKSPYLVLVIRRFVWHKSEFQEVN